MAYDRAAIMRDAWSRFRDGKRLGHDWDFARCLRVAWTAAKLRQEFPRRRYQPAETSAVIYA